MTLATKIRLMNWLNVLIENSIKFGVNFIYVCIWYGILLWWFIIGKETSSNIEFIGRRRYHVPRLGEWTERSYRVISGSLHNRTKCIECIRNSTCNWKQWSWRPGKCWSRWSRWSCCCRCCCCCSCSCRCSYSCWLFGRCVRCNCHCRCPIVVFLFTTFVWKWRTLQYTEQCTNDKNH